MPLSAKYVFVFGPPPPPPASSKKSPPKEEKKEPEPLPAPSEVYATSVFGAGGAPRDEDEGDKAAPLVVGEQRETERQRKGRQRRSKRERD